ncbi:MAG: NAD-dependent succinate-semialdehyde dehydrogenase, partial [Mesorhizobium sp.]|nr:NAD-dependent succinate-semialdehyde dehydrogenase [Mesorhizobium sp.]
MYPELFLFIDGARHGVEGRAHEAVINPATGETIGMLPLAGEADLQMALEAADRAFKTWRLVPAAERCRILRNAAGLLRARAGELALRLTLEQGKPLRDAAAEYVGAAEIFEWYEEEGRRAYGRVIPGRAVGLRQIVLQEPIGPVAAFSPWNFPVITSARKIAASLAAGCTCILKPSEETPSSVLAVASILEEVGLPPGVLNIVFGVPEKVSTTLVRSPLVRKVSLTGSTRVGRELARLAAEGPKPATMELGGHAPVIVAGDVDASVAARLSAMARFRNAGQTCIAPTRFYAHKSIAAKFVEGFVEQVKTIKLGDGREDDVTMGPLANARRVETISELVDDAVQKGAKVAHGAKRAGNRGYFYEPTVLVDVPGDARIMSEEPFGPVAIINSYDDLDSVIGEANGLPYGLAAYVFSNSDPLLARLVRDIEAGAVGINSFGVSLPEAPFGGVKSSGYGSEGGYEG